MRRSWSQRSPRSSLPTGASSRARSPLRRARASATRRAILHLLTGQEPDPERVRGLETYLNTVSDHGFNASTFTARVIVSTRSDLISAITGAVGALKGPLHGGAPGPALDMVFEIGSADRAEEVLRDKLGRGERLMGFGHRVYRVRDPRADVLGAAAERFYRRAGDMALYDLARSVEATALRLLREHKPDRKLETNVEFYTALLLHGLELPTELFTPGLRGRPRRRLDRARLRATRTGPADPAPVRVRGRAGPPLGGSRGSVAPWERGRLARTRASRVAGLTARLWISRDSTGGGQASRSPEHCGSPESIDGLPRWRRRKHPRYRD